METQLAPGDTIVEAEGMFLFSLLTIGLPFLLVGLIVGSLVLVAYTIIKTNKEPKGLDEREYIDYLKMTRKVHQGTFTVLCIIALVGGVNLVALGIICVFQLLAERHYRNKLSKSE